MIRSPISAVSHPTFFDEKLADSSKLWSVAAAAAKEEKKRKNCFERLTNIVDGGYNQTKKNLVPRYSNIEVIWRDMNESTRVKNHSSALSVTTNAQ